MKKAQKEDKSDSSDSSEKGAETSESSSSPSSEEEGRPPHIVKTTKRQKATVIKGNDACLSVRLSNL